MRSMTIITTILAMSIAIPAGILLTGTFTIPQEAEPTSERNVAESVARVPQESIKVQLPSSVAPGSKPSIVADPPLRENPQIRPPEQEIMLPPPKLPKAQPAPQQRQPAPVQIPQLQENQRSLIQVKPSGSVFKGGMVALQRAQWEGEWRGREGDVVRAQLGDLDIAPFQQLTGLHRDANRTISLKQALEEIDVRTRDILLQCSPADREIGGCPGRPTMYLDLNENQTIALVNLVNPPLDIPGFFIEEAHRDGTLERRWGAVITFNGIRYLLSIYSSWIG